MTGHYYIVVGSKRPGASVDGYRKKDGTKVCGYVTRSYEVCQYLSRCRRTTRICPVCKRSYGQTADCLTCSGTGFVPWEEKS